VPILLAIILQFADWIKMRNWIKLPH